MDTRKIAVGAAAAAVLIVGGGAAIAAGQATETTADETKQEEPSYKGSIQAPSDAERDGTTEDAKGSENEAAEERSEAAEEQQLQSLAKIGRSQAEQTALKEVPGTVKEAELGDENGYVVWEIEVAADGGSYREVEVDAGNGRILAQEAEDNEDSAQDDKDEANEAAEAPDE